MKIKYLGTAAAEAVPAPFCECETCERAREKGGRNIRTRSQAVIDDRILIDFCADTYMHCLREGIKLCNIDACIITHNHSDHLYPAELFCREKCAAHMKNEKPFEMYGAADSAETVKKNYSGYDRLVERNQFVFHTVEAFKPFNIGEYRITPLRADHGTALPLIYVIEKGGKTMLYAHDTGIFPEETWAYLEKSGFKFDFISYDCTNVLLYDYPNRGHMGLGGNVEVRERLAKMGLTHEKTIHVVNHFSHNGLAGYDELVPVAGEQGFLVSYDGMEVEF